MMQSDGMAPRGSTKPTRKPTTSAPGRKAANIKGNADLAKVPSFINPQPYRDPQTVVAKAPQTDEPRRENSFAGRALRYTNNGRVV